VIIDSEGSEKKRAIPSVPKPKTFKDWIIRNVSAVMQPNFPRVVNDLLLLRGLQISDKLAAILKNPSRRSQALVWKRCETQAVFSAICFSDARQLYLSISGVLCVTEAAIAERLELANERILARESIARRALLKRKARRPSVRQHGVRLLQVFH
jgi:hypothetical protein